MSLVFLDNVAAAEVVETGKPALYGHFGKRALDVVVALLAIPVIAPVVAVLWLVMKAEGGAGFYSQPRIGRGGRVFKCWKIRTMAADADRLLAEHLSAHPECAAEWAKNQKLRNDPRITPYGHFLRKTSLDELPQVWNVLIGDMSMVGPRPFTPEQKAAYDAAAPLRSYYRLRPGITGPWQVHARGNSAFRDRVAYDESYAAKVSWWRDLVLGAKTVLVVLKATGR